MTGIDSTLQQARDGLALDGVREGDTIKIEGKPSTIQAVNLNSHAVDELHARLCRVEAWQAEELAWHAADEALTGWQRLKRVFGR